MAKTSEPKDEGFSANERAAMKERAAELKTQSRRRTAADKAAADAADVRAKIEQMPESDRALAERVHTIVTSVAPELLPKLYYGQPAYARKGKVVCFFRSGQMDKEPYSTFGFSAEANLADSSGMWPTSYALAEDVSEQAWDELAELVKRAAS